ncbi:MAG: coproporphyrinogen III oxidase [Bacteroidetes bacterium QH_1_64_81]|nr:MAG: coproporphyrinogen III oxidase [Bacteroidetes bacterium QH_1_64_81]
MGDTFERLETLREDPREDIPMAHRMKRFVEALQVRITRTLDDLEPSASFQVDRWSREEGGGGITAVVEGGELFEKGGVNTSAVHGPLPERMAREFEVEEAPFYATGLSLVVHPQSPHVPTVHANFRYFALGDDLMNPVDQWFGGGADLTPYYPRLDDTKHFHRVWKDVCDRHDVADYDAFKEACDEYFYLDHRSEARGVGGIFYDYLREDPEQRIRRGRYVEFNLVYDRGTKFGLESDGRTESILMSMPPQVQWQYDYTPDPGTPEADAQWYFTARDWLNLTKNEAPERTV